MLPRAEVGEWVPLTDYRRLPGDLPAVYVIRHAGSGKEYVGKSTCLHKRMRRHCSSDLPYYISRALRQHGLPAFQVCLVYQGPNAAEEETKHIDGRGSLAPAGYNMTIGGEGGGAFVWTVERRQAARERAAGKLQSEETKARRKVSMKGFGMGWLMTPEIMKKALETRKGLPGIPCSESKKEKIAAAQRGKPRPQTSGPLGSMYGRSRGTSPRARTVLAWAPDSMTPMTFDCVADAAAHFKVVSEQISVWCSKECRPRIGWRFAYLK